MSLRPRTSSARAVALLTALVVACTSLAAPADAAIRDWRYMGKKPQEQQKKDKKEEKEKGPFKPWSEVTKDATKIEGFFDVYEKPDKVYFVIKQDQLDMDFLGVWTFAGGIGTNFLLGGLPLSDRLLAFERVGNKVMLVQKNALFTADEGSPMEKAVDLSHGNSVLAMLKIESEHEESKDLLVDMTGVLVSDIADLGTRASVSINNQPVRLDKSRSALTMLKNFPQNLEVEALLTYSPSRQSGNFLTFGLNPMLYAVPDQRYIPLKVRYSFVQLPEEPDDAAPG